MPKRDASATATPLALTMGDPAGIGLDITLKAWHARDALMLPPFCLYADPDAVAERAEQLRLETPIMSVGSPIDAGGQFATTLPIRPVKLAEPVRAGTPSIANARAVIDAVEYAVADVKADMAAAVVTNPIAKAVLYEAGFEHPGHTEFLSSLAKKHWPGGNHHPAMMLSGKDLKVVPLTIHIPLADVPGKITASLIEATVRIVAMALQRDFAITTPRLAIAGLNPHAGEHGTLGREDEDIISPAIAKLRKSGLNIAGPLPADTMFHERARAEYDAAICMYHDQALIPVKTLAFDEGVNTTLGLPFIRTSPDHGTAFSIAGTDKASPMSLIEALKLASRMAEARRKVPA